MAVALAYPDTEKGGRGKKLNSSKNEEFNRVSAGNLSMARFVLRNCRDKAEEVLRNARPTIAYWNPTRPLMSFRPMSTDAI